MDSVPKILETHAHILEMIWLSEFKNCHFEYAF